MNRTKRTVPSMAAMLLCLVAAWLGTSSTSVAATNQFRGVNWADGRDNFQSGVLYISGLSSSDTYDSAKAVGTAIVDQFISKLGANAVRIPINEATVKTYWSTYTGAIDAVLAKAKLVFCYWDSAKSNKPASMDAWWTMWKTVVDKYGGNEDAYFEPFNEPNMYSQTDLANLYNDWLTHYPTVPKGRVILDGTGNAQSVTGIGQDSRLKECLLAVHDYSFFGSESMTKESDWENSIKGEVGSFADRTVCTEWGGPMSPGSKNGKSYDYLDYSKSPTNYFEAYIRGISNQLRSWNMGSFYWPGLRDGDWYSMTIKSGSGANITLSIPNKSGLERMQYAWGPVSTGGNDGGAGGSGGRSGADGGGTGGNVADGAAGGTTVRPDALGTDGPGGGRGGSGGVTGNAGATAGSDAGNSSSVGGQGGVSANGGTPRTSGTATATSGGAAGSGSSAGGIGGTTIAGGGSSASGGSGSSGAGANGGAGQSAAGSSGASQPTSNPSGQSSGCSCRLGRDSRNSSIVWVGLLLMIAAIRRKKA